MRMTPGGKTSDNVFEWVRPMRMSLDGKTSENVSRGKDQW
jgi:hypothetical protein